LHGGRRRSGVPTNKKFDEKRRLWRLINEGVTGGETTMRTRDQ
jgi:hypothetical protein